MEPEGCCGRVQSYNVQRYLKPTEGSFSKPLIHKASVWLQHTHAYSTHTVHNSHACKCTDTESTHSEPTHMNIGILQLPHIIYTLYLLKYLQAIYCCHRNPFSFWAYFSGEWLWLTMKELAVMTRWCACVHWTLSQCLIINAQGLIFGHPAVCGKTINRTYSICSSHSRDQP